MTEVKPPERKPYKLKYPIKQAGELVDAGETVHLFPHQIERMKAYEVETDEAAKAEESKGVNNG
ncbi:MAG: hypothetical protein KZQ93_15810 [Candidatus Thiodiazotropha sp. (ex Monitilora ramsayi)]|nr:hypothetical protein [Candidatus Thiodiazotropha sp. (ex Monitilora ramsayi)]